MRVLPNRRPRFIQPLALMVLGLALGVSPVPAQDLARAIEEGNPSVEVRPEQATPQETVRTFFRAFRLARETSRQDLTSAVEALDLSGLSAAVRAIKGRELAIQLKEVLDRTVYIDVEAIPGNLEGPPFLLVSRPQGDVILARGGDGHWRFTAETVGRVPAMYEAARADGVVDGVQEVDRRLSPALWLEAKMPEGLRQQSFLLKRWKWLALLVLVFGGMILDRLTTSLVARFWSSIFRRRAPDEIDRELATSTARPLGILAMAMLWSAALPWLGLPVRALEVLSSAIALLIAVGIVWAAYRLVDLLCAFLESKAAQTVSKTDDILIPLVRKALKVFVTVFGFVFVAENLDVEIGSLLAGIGLSGLALALAAQDAIKNLFGSVLVILDRPFEVGDWVVTGNVEGSVEELGFRSTRIRTVADSVVTLPNANLISAAVDNFGRRNYRRWNTTLGVAYDTPPAVIDQFCEDVKELIRAHPKARKEGFQVTFSGFGESSLDVRCNLYFVDEGIDAYVAAKHDLGLDILRLAERLGVEFAFPTRTVHVLGAEGSEEDKNSGSPADRRGS